MDGPPSGLFQSGDNSSQHDAFQTTVRSRWGKEEEQHLRGLIAFNQWFIITYQAVLLAVVLLFSVQHLASILFRARRRAVREHQSGTCDQDGTASSGHNSGSSPSSSTLDGNATPPLLRKYEANEHTSLLGKDTAHEDPPLIAGMVSSIKAALMYQPRPIPFVNKRLPSNATTLAVLALLGLNIFYTFYKIPMTAPMSFVLGDRSGLLFVANLPWLYLLSAKNQPIKHLTGYSYENLNILHRRLGEILCSLAVVHGASMVVAWWFFFRPTGMTLGHFLLLKIILLGLGAFAAYETLHLTSLASFRQRWYELFLGLHIVLQTAALVLLWFHHRGSRTYVVVALAIFLIDRLVFRFLLKVRTVRADLTVMSDGDTVLVSASWPTSPSPSHSRWSWATFTNYFNTTHGWKPSEHIFLTVPALGLKHSPQTHPFTIASAAPSQSQDRHGQHAWFNLILRAHTGFTRDLLAYAKTHSSADVRLDGPYGSLHALEMLRSADLSVIVAGGSGIAVAYPLLWSLLHDHQHAGDAEIAAARRKKLCLVWVIHEAEHIEWIGRERLRDLEEKGLELVVPPATRDRGRPDVGAIVDGLVDQYAKTSEQGGFNAGVVVSGPDGMNRAVRNTCARLVRKGRDVEVAVEQYAW